MKKKDLPTTFFRSHKKQYTLQTLLAIVALFITLLALHNISNAFILASIGATTVIIFTSPNTPKHGAKHLIGAYIIGLTIGTIFNFIQEYTLTTSMFLNLQHFAPELFGAMSVGCTMFIMYSSHLRHPPVAGIALGLVLHEWTIGIIYGALAAIIVLTLIRRILSPYLINLK